MAEYVEIDPATTPGSPANPKIATDHVTIGADQVEVQREKGGWGSDGVWNDITNTTPLPITTPPAINTHGSITSLAISGTAVVASYVAGGSFRFRGFIGIGTGDGVWVVKYNGTAKYSIKTNIIMQTAELILPDPDSSAAGTTVTVEVTNGGTGAADFEATILGS